MTSRCRLAIASAACGALWRSSRARPRASARPQRQRPVQRQRGMSPLISSDGTQQRKPEKQKKQRATDSFELDSVSFSFESCQIQVWLWWLTSPLKEENMTIDLNRRKPQVTWKGHLFLDQPQQDPASSFISSIEISCNLLSQSHLEPDPFRKKSLEMPSLGVWKDCRLHLGRLDTAGAKETSLRQNGLSKSNLTSKDDYVKPRFFSLVHTFSQLNMYIYIIPFVVDHASAHHRCWLSRSHLPPEEVGLRSRGPDAQTQLRLL